MTKTLLPRYVYIPQDSRLREVVDGFEVRWGFPQVAGAIDGTHIPIVCPQENPLDYYNRKGFYSILMQALVDFRGLFMDVYIGWPVMPEYLPIPLFIVRGCRVHYCQAGIN